MKTSDLQGAELDFWVAKAIGWTEGRLGTQGKNDPEPQGWFGKGAGQYGTHKKYFKPSTNWSHGGPLIEKYEIHLEHFGIRAGDPKWIAIRVYKKAANGIAHGSGNTPLIAAMRAIVASVYGESVDE